MSAHDRIEELLAIAKEEEVAVNHPSLLDLLDLVENPPLIFLLDNGNFRCRWQFENCAVAVELVGKREVEILVHPKNGDIWSSKSN